MPESTNKKVNDTKMLQPPKGLTRGARSYWIKLVKSLKDANIAEETDVHLVTLTVFTWEEYMTARKEVMTSGGTIRTTSERGYEIVKSNPSAAIMNQAAARLQTCLSNLGLTPKARGGKASSADDEDPIGGLLNG